MEIDKFYGFVKGFLEAVSLPEKKVIIKEVSIYLQPNMISINANYPTDEQITENYLKERVGKENFRKMIGIIQQFHQSSTMNGQNKWNKTHLTMDAHGQITGNFLWDEEWEQENINSYKDEVELTRSKWYWEE